MNIEKSERILPLSSGQNFRDMGGYRTADGRMVKWGHIFRSGHMAKINDEDRVRLHDLGIKKICDFRANGERAERPTLWHEGSETDLWARDHEFSSGAMTQMLGRTDFEAAHIRDYMLKIYGELPYEQAESYRETFSLIAGGQVPLVFNCTAGKDRTGLAAAILLELLGVSRDVIVEDYLLTNHAIDGLFAYMADTKKYGAFVTAKRDEIMPLMIADADYLNVSFAKIDSEHGSMESYAREILGFDKAIIESICENLLD